MAAGDLVLISVADRLLVIMTADLACLKNVRMVCETMSQIGVPDDAIELLLNRLSKSNTNAEFLASLTKAAAVEEAAK